MQRGSTMSEASRAKIRATLAQPDVKARQIKMRASARERQTGEDPRLLFILHMREQRQGHKEIGVALGISHQRVGQILRNSGMGGGGRIAPDHDKPDPRTVLAFARSRECHSFTDIGKHCGALQCTTAIRRMLYALEVHAALKRLYRWRAAYRKRNEE